MRNPIAACLVASIVFSAAAPVHAACAVDADCHPEEVCERNVCTTPAVTVPPTPPPEGPPPPMPESYPPVPPGMEYGAMGPMGPMMHWHHYSPALRLTGIILFSVGVPVAIAGLVLLPAYRSAYVESGDPAYTTEATLLGVGSAAWVTGIILWSIGGHRVYTSMAQITPVVQPLSGGVQVSLLRHF